MAGDGAHIVRVYITMSPERKLTREDLQIQKELHRYLGYATDVYRI